MKGVATGAEPRGLPLPYSLLGLGGWLLLCFGAAAVGTLFPPGAWYGGLEKPSWNPPNWLFGPVWTLLYLMMAFAAWLVWKRGGFARQSRALVLFLVQLGFNAAWSWIFFGLHLMLTGFLTILLIIAFTFLTCRAFHRVSRIAAWLLVPYLGWLAFAGVLNFTLWRLNS